MTLVARAVTDRSELRQILDLQRENLAPALSLEEQKAQGFVTVQHTLERIEQMHVLAPSIIVKSGNDLAGYALTMTLEAQQQAPILRSMFRLFDSLNFHGRPLPSFPFYVMGQICVARAYRGQGVFDELYRGHRRIYADRFELLVTEIATRNTRSLRAHERVGFEPIHRYRDDVDEWVIVAWDWSSNAPSGDRSNAPR
jgi:GNAT superfamily N-acetyltransferase